MFANKFQRKLNFKLLKVWKRNFELLTPEEYFVNYKESIKKTSYESCKLLPLPEASKIKK
jgi:hypothetical protein